MISIFIIFVTVLASWKGIKERSFYERYKFNTEKVFVFKEYYRLVTSGFMHLNWMHLAFNMLALLFFSQSIESFLGPLQFLLIYFASLVGGNLLALFIHRNHGDYSAAGASGAVAGIIFAAIAVIPGMRIGLFILPPMPGWIYGLIYVLISILGIRSRADNIGHDSHLGGAMVGMISAIVMNPSSLVNNYLVILVVSVPAIAFIVLIATRPHVLVTDQLFTNRRQKYYSVDHKYNAEKADIQKEVDRILDKISRKGMSSLTKKEKETLEQHSKTVR